MHKLLLLTGSIMGGLAVAIGAFGAHGLRAILAATGKGEIFETAVKYHFYHSLALLAAGILLFNFQQKHFQYAGYCFLTGIVIFSGSLYILSVTGITKWGAVTPIGGLLFIIGWVFLAIGIARL